MIAVVRMYCIVCKASAMEEEPMKLRKKERKMDIFLAHHMLYAAFTLRACRHPLNDVQISL